MLRLTINEPLNGPDFIWNDWENEVMSIDVLLLGVISTIPLDETNQEDRTLPHPGECPGLTSGILIDWVCLVFDNLIIFCEDIWLASNHEIVTKRSESSLGFQSLDAIESFILDRYEGTQAILVQSEKDILDGIARYIGETFRKELGGHWEIRLDDPRYAYYGLPQLTGFSERDTPICPHSLATACADRRKGTYLRAILENSKKQLEK